MYLVHSLTLKKLAQIGRLFGGLHIELSIDRSIHSLGHFLCRCDWAVVYANSALENWVRTQLVRGNVAIISPITDLNVQADGGNKTHII